MEGGEGALIQGGGGAYFKFRPIEGALIRGFTVLEFDQMKIQNVNHLGVAQEAPTGVLEVGEARTD